MKECDCLNTCGDDPALEKHPELSCDNRKAEQQRAIERSRQHKQLLEDAARYRLLGRVIGLIVPFALLRFRRKAYSLAAIARLAFGWMKL